MSLRTRKRFSNLGRSLRTERLETRDLLAGDVAVIKSGSTLNITATGSTANDVVVVGDAEAGTYTVYGIDADASGDDTLINGELTDFSTTGAVFTGITTINVNLNGGDDFFAITNVPESAGSLRLNNLTVKMGAGDDRVSIGTTDDTELGDAGLDAGVIGSLAGFSGSVDEKGAVSVDGGADDDAISIRNFAGDSTIALTLGTGDDSLTLDTVEGTNIKADFGAGAVLASVAAVTTTGTTNTTGDLILTGTNSGVAGTGEVTVAGATVRDLIVTLGSGENTVDVSGVTASRDVKVTTGSGNDIANVSSTTAARDILLSYGGGELDSTLNATLDAGRDFKLTATNAATISGGLTIAGLIAGRNASISLGNGVNTVDVSDVDAEGAFSLTTGSGDDTVTVTTLAAASAAFKLGDGLNGATISGTTLTGAFSFTSGSGDDTLSVDPLDAASAGINLGNGLNTATLNAFTLTGSFGFTSGTGDDTVTMTTLSGENATFSLGNGLNTATIDDATLTGNLTVNAGTGDDTVNFGGTTTAQDVVVNAGAGSFTSNANGTIETSRDLRIVATGNANTTNDISLIGFSIGRNATFTLGTGQNDLNLQTGDVGGNLVVSAPSVDDNTHDNFADLFIQGVDVELLASLITGTGNDSVSFLDSNATTLNIITGNGNDEVDVSHSLLEEGQLLAVRSLIDTGNGNDDVHIGNDGVDLLGSAEFDFLTVLLGNGDDCLAMGSTTVNNTSVRNGGAGTDNFDDNDGNTFPAQNSKNTFVLFETFEDCDEEEEVDEA